MLHRVSCVCSHLPIPFCRERVALIFPSQKNYYETSRRGRSSFEKKNPKKETGRNGSYDTVVVQIVWHTFLFFFFFFQQQKKKNHPSNHPFSGVCFDRVYIFFSCVHRCGTWFLGLSNGPMDFLSDPKQPTCQQLLWFRLKNTLKSQLVKLFFFLNWREKSLANPIQSAEFEKNLKIHEISKKKKKRRRWRRQKCDDEDDDQVPVDDGGRSAAAIEAAAVRAASAGSLVVRVARLRPGRQTEQHERSGSSSRRSRRSRRRSRRIGRWWRSIVQSAESRHHKDDNDNNDDDTIQHHAGWLEVKQKEKKCLKFSLT